MEKKHPKVNPRFYFCPIYTCKLYYHPYSKPEDDEQETKSIKDSLSVFSSFGSAFSQGDKQAEFNLGKLYATGAAAQHLSWGMGKKMKEEGTASNAKAVIDCIAKLSEIFGEVLKPEVTKICQFRLPKEK